VLRRERAGEACVAGGAGVFPRAAAGGDSRLVRLTGYAGDGGPYAVAHRGGAGLAPENTLAAFERSYALGVRYLETDVRVTADGVPVAFHDAHLRRTTGARGRIADLTHAQLRALRVGGEPVPTLAEVLERFPDARFTIDLKVPRSLGPLAGVLRATGAADRVCLAGAADGLLAEARDVLGPAVTTALGWQSLTHLAVCARTGRRPRGIPAAQFAHVPLKLGRVPVFVDRLVAMVHGLGLRVLVWTVDDPALMHRLLDAGVDGAITDRPDVLREVLVARDEWRAPRPLPAPPPQPGGRIVASSDAEASSVPAKP
jgi:glycerophosphoryl diester phosphodiesterase